MLDKVVSHYKEFIDYLNDSDMSQDETDVVRGYMDTVIETYEREIESLKTKAGNPLNGEGKRKVRYIGGMDHHDGLATGKIYTIIEETQAQFIVRNELNGISRLVKDKFEEVG
jgi:hypothetical protein